jgi:hypothetical protein
MIGHVVLFRPKPDLSTADREAFVAALERALKDIPGIAGARVGRRLRLGRLYDAQGAQDYPFAAFLEFNTEADLRAYLDHPTHQELGRRFYQTADAALACDFELLDGSCVRELL